MGELTGSSVEVGTLLEIELVAAVELAGIHCE
jgi:hypothetical protein